LARRDALNRPNQLESAFMVSPKISKAVDQLEAALKASKNDRAQRALSDADLKTLRSPDIDVQDYIVAQRVLNNLERAGLGREEGGSEVAAAIAVQRAINEAVIALKLPPDIGEKDQKRELPMHYKELVYSPGIYKNVRSAVDAAQAAEKGDPSKLDVAAKVQHSWKAYSDVLKKVIDNMK
jgi:hypothetical protein